MSFSHQAIKVRVQVPSTNKFLADVLLGLGQSPKRLPCKYFYDEVGCTLFERICDLDEYYPTRTELAIMRAHVAEMATAIGSQAMLIELGSGSSTKTRWLLDHLPELAAYVPVDIAREHLELTARALAGDYPALQVLPVAADFTHPFELPSPKREVARRVVYFPGSTIGNFDSSAARELVGTIAGLVGERGGLLIGIDLKKSPQRLEAAYNDREGVTAAFNLNLLERINRELDGNFDLEQFSHQAHYNPARGRVEMHLVSLADQEVDVAGESFRFLQGETICTEHSHKYEVQEFASLAAEAGFQLQHSWTDPDRLFAVLYLDLPGD